MNREQRVIAAALQSREAFYTISKVLEEDDLRPQYMMLWKFAEEFYDNDKEATNVDEAILIDGLLVKHPRQAEVLKATVAELSEVSVPNAVEEYVELRKDAARLRMAEALISGAEDEDITDYYDKWNTTSTAVEQEEDDEPPYGIDLSELIVPFHRDNLVRTSPAALNARIGGGFIGGDCVLIFAPPEVGKTLIGINMACGFLRNGNRVLYLCNEDAGAKIKMRFINNLSAMDKQEVLADPQKASNRARQKGVDNLTYRDITPGSPREIESLIQRFEPKILFVDQFSNMDSNGRMDAGVEKLGALAREMRTIAKKYDIVLVMVTQAGDSASGKRVLDMSDVYGSKTAIPAQFDLMLGVGMTEEMRQQNRRNISMPKNKLNNDHGSFEVDINPYLSRIVE